MVRTWIKNIALTLSSCIRKTWMRAITWCLWLADPEGPSYKRTLRIGLFCTIGVILAASGLLVTLFSIYNEICNNQCKFAEDIFISFPLSGYVGGCFLFFGVSFWLFGRHPLRIELKTAEYSEQIDVLVSDVRSKLPSINGALRKEVEALICKLEKHRDMPSEVSVIRLTPLRRLQVFTYKKEELRPLLLSELEELKYYSGQDDTIFVMYEKSIKHAIEANNGSTKNNNTELRQYLIILREYIDELKYKYGHGEAIIESVTYWSIFSGIALFLVGISSLFCEPYFGGDINVGHWIVFAFAGALLATVSRMKKWDSFEIAEDEGTLQLRRMAMGWFIGTISAVVLYLAIMSGVLDGSAFPELTRNAGSKPLPMVNNALSVFWAIFAGFSGGRLMEGIFERIEQAGTVKQSAS